MTGTVHKIIVTFSQVVGAVGALILTSDQVPFDLDARDVGLTLVWAGQIATIIATSIRGNWLGAVTGTSGEG